MMENVENKLKDLLLKDLEFKINNKIIRRGKLRVFNTKQFFIKLNLIQNDNERIYELPYPYDMKDINGNLTFDYCLSSVCPPTEEVYYKIMTCDKSKASRLHNQYLEIHKIDPE